MGELYLLILSKGDISLLSILFVFPEILLLTLVLLHFYYIIPIVLTWGTAWYKTFWFFLLAMTLDWVVACTKSFPVPIAVNTC